MKHAVVVTDPVTDSVTDPNRRSVNRVAARSSERKTQRRDWLRRWSASLVASLLTVAMAGVVGAESARERYDGELEKWQLSAGVEMGIYGTSAEGDATGTTLVGPRATNIDQLRGDEGPEVIAPLRDENDIYSAVLGGTFGVMTPAPFDIASQPRLFLDVSILPALTLESSVVRDGDPGEFRLPPDITQRAAFVAERLVLGRGTKITSQQQGVQFHAGLGVAFTFDLEESRIRIKPSLRYSRTENKVSATAKRAVRTLNVDPTVVDADGRSMKVRSLDHFRLLSLGDNFTEVYHAAGPALEIEFLTEEAFGPFHVSLFIKGGASYIFGDLKTEFVDSNPLYPEETVRFKLKNDPWSYLATAGIRLSFSPDFSFRR